MASCLSIAARSPAPQPAAARQLVRRVPLISAVGALVPDGAGIVAAEHGGRLARLVRDAERQIALDQPLSASGVWLVV
jgi:hypothetical protein